MSEELSKACSELSRSGADIAVLASVANVTYVTGVEVPIPYGAMAELTYAPWLTVIAVREERGWAIVPNFAASLFDEQSNGFEARSFETFDSFTDSSPRETYLSSLTQAITEAGPSSNARIAFESRAVPSMVREAIANLWDDAVILEAEGPIAEARKTKTDREIMLLQRASHLADVGHRALAELVQESGHNEIDMWAALSASIFKEAGQTIGLSGELVTGPRTSSVAYPNGPNDRTTADGDPALMDLSGRASGYWFDCTNTHLIGEPEANNEQRRYAHASQDACEAGMAALKPGAKASDAAAAAERAFAMHGLPMAHYAGHQIGVTVNELPRLVPYDHATIEVGMVFCVEPGAYQGPGGSFGARSEKMVLVRDDGPEVLSTFEWGISR